MDHRRRNLIVGGSLVAAGIVGGVGPAACAWSKMHADRMPGSDDLPERPVGTAAPLLEEDIAPALARLDGWYAKHLPPEKYRFNPPASDAEIGGLEATIGFTLPQSYRQLYRWHNGETNDRRGHFYGLPLLPLAWVAEEWLSWNRILAGIGGNRYVVPGGAWPAGAVDPAYINPRWIALTADGSGNSIGLDFDPWPGGRVGQVILFGRDEDVKVVLAQSLGEFLTWVADLLERGNFRFGVAPGETVLREFRLKSPPSDHFHEGARKLLRAPSPFL